MFNIYDEIIDRYLKPNGVTSFHIGLDEVWNMIGHYEDDLQKDKSPFCQCDKCREKDYGDLIVEYVIKIAKHLKEKGIKILTAQLQDSHLYYDTPMTGPTAIVMGTEATGLTPQWRRAADAHIRIPMLGQLDSLNVSVSAAILLYEAVRQRQNAE